MSRSDSDSTHSNSDYTHDSDSVVSDSAPSPQDKHVGRIGPNESTMDMWAAIFPPKTRKRWKSETMPLAPVGSPDLTVAMQDELMRIPANASCQRLFSREELFYRLGRDEKGKDQLHPRFPPLNTKRSVHEYYRIEDEFFQAWRSQDWKSIEILPMVGAIICQHMTVNEEFRKRPPQERFRGHHGWWSCFGTRLINTMNFLRAKIPPEEVHLRLMLDTELGVSIVYTQAMVEMRGLYIAGIDNDGTITQADKDVTLEKIRAWKIQNGLITDPRRPPSSSEPSESSDSEEEGSSIASSPTVNIPADDYTTGLASNRPPQV